MRKLLPVLVLTVLLMGCVTTNPVVKHPTVTPKQEVVTDKADEEQVFDVRVRNKTPDVLETKIDKKRFPVKWAIINKFGQPDGHDINYFYDNGEEQCLETWYFGNVIVQFKNGELISIRTLNPAKVRELLPSPSTE